MADEKVYYQETIEENPFPQEGETVSFDVSQQSAKDEYANQEIDPQTLPSRRLARELIASALNTKSRRILGEFQFTESGAIQIGKYVNGDSGDLRITPDGLTARDSAGLTTFSIDGTDGSAVFKGTVQAGTLISGEVIVGNNNIIIDGASRQIIINDGTHDRVLIGYQKDGF